MQRRKQSSNFYMKHLLITVAILLVLAAGCSITVMQKPDINLPKPMDARVLVLGEITSDHPGWKSLGPDFRREFVEYLVDRKVFDRILNGPVPQTDSALVLSGIVTEYDEGNKAARALISFGAGKMVLKGRFELKDAKGATLLRFESHGADYGGGGLLLGVVGLVGVVQERERIIKGFAVNVANTVMRWSKGEITE